jgi:orotate phosphoribosyltransferase
MTTGLDIRALLESSGALRQGHFRLSSGRHAAEYVQCALLLEDPARARAVGRALAALLEETEPQSVVAPALGAVIIGHEVAAALGAPFRFTEREGETMRLRRGFSLAPGERVVLVEDVVTTGRSTLETADVVRRSGAKVVGIGAIIDRISGERPFDGPFRALLRWKLASFEAAVCPQCQAGTPLEKPGSRPEAGSKSGS